MNGRKFNEEQTWLEMVEGQIGYKFNNKDLLQQAFIRKSYSMEKGGENNEILEFIGDRSLDMIVTKILMEHYGYMASDNDDIPNENGAFCRSEYDEFCSDISEGELTEVKSQLVRKKNLAKRIDFMDLSEYLIMGKGDIRNRVDKKDSVKEDLFEAIIGAVTIDSNWNFDIIEDVVEVMLDPDLVLLADSEQKNYVKLVQDWLAAHYDMIPLFVYENKRYGMGVNSNIKYMSYLNNVKIVRYNEVNPWINTSNLQYECQMKLTDELPIFSAFGESKSEARKKVCEVAYKYLEQENMLWTIQDEIANPNINEAVSQLEILARRGYFDIPTYDFRESYDDNGSPIWHAICYIRDENLCIEAKATSKKQAKKEAAFRMLKIVMFDEE